jgi:hypothetical protein
MSMTNTQSDLDFIEFRLKAIETELKMIEEAAQRIRERQVRK